MATPSLAIPKKRTGTVAVVIEVDKQGNIVVEPDTFWVSKSGEQEVKWFCAIAHNHEEHKPCFKVDFKDAENSPFEKPHFEHHHAHSGCVKSAVVPDQNKLYKYTVSMPGKAPLDPTGGVEP